MLMLVGMLMMPLISVANTSLNDVVKEARRSGQVLSAKTRDGVHQVRVMTPQGSVKTIRKPASQNNQNQRQPEPSNRQNYYQQPQQPDNHREYRHSRQPEFRRFQRPSVNQAEPKSQPLESRNSPRSLSRPSQPRRSQVVPNSRPPRVRQPEPKDPD